MPQGERGAPSLPTSETLYSPEMRINQTFPRYDLPSFSVETSTASRLGCNVLFVSPTNGWSFTIHWYVNAKESRSESVASTTTEIGAASVRGSGTNLIV